MNSTDQILPEDPYIWLDSLIPMFWMYIVQGTSLTIANGLILLAIVRYELLRKKKEYMVVAGLALVDCMNGAATLLAGLVRNFYISERTAHIKVSRWSCLLTSWNEIYIWTDPLQAIMLMVVSIDRLIAVSFPLKYYKYTRVYSCCLVGSAYTFMFIVVIIGHITSFPYVKPEREAICLSSFAFDTLFYKIHNWLRVIPGTLSIILYGFALIIFSKRNPVGQKEHKTNAAKNHQRTQRKLTKTLGISSVFTLIFYVIPMLVETVFGYMNTSGKMLAAIIPYTFIINNLNPMTNIFIYYTRQRDLRVAIKCLMICKEVTPAMLGQLSKTRNPSSHRNSSHRPSRNVSPNVFNTVRNASDFVREARSEVISMGTIDTRKPSHTVHN